MGKKLQDLHFGPQDYRLWASWSPYDGPKSFLLGRAESVSLQRTWSPCTVNGPSSSHCKGPEVHPTLMDLGPSCWEGLSPPHIDGPKRAMHSQGSIPLQRTEFISTHGPDRDNIGWWFILHQRTQVQGTWYDYFRLTLSQFNGLAKTKVSFKNQRT